MLVPIRLAALDLGAGSIDVAVTLMLAASAALTLAEIVVAEGPNGLRREDEPGR